MTKFKMKWLALAVSGALVAACGSDDSNELAALPAGDMLVLTATNQLISYDKTQPGVIRTSATISGIAAGFGIVGIDFRPRDGQLYAVARNNSTTTGVPNEGRLYTINTRTGAATEVAILTNNPSNTVAYSGLPAAPATFGVDFNPMADALRIVSSTGVNLRVSFATLGSTFTDGNVNGAAADISGAAYTNSFDGTTATRLFNINATTDTLTLQDLPNAGTQVVAAPLGVDATGNVAFDIDARNNRGLAVMTVGGVQGLYNISIPDSTATLPATAAAASLVGALNVPNPVVGLVLIQPAAPQAIALDGNTAGSQRLLKFGIRTPNAATATAITGLPAGERLLSIDFRPSNSTVYGLSSAGKVFTINTDTGAATLAVTLNVANNIVNGVADGKRYQIDINPQVDALRIVSSVGSGTQGENYRIVGANLVTGSANAGVVATTPPDLPLSAGFSVVNIAYTNSFANSAPAATRLFDIDGANNRLALQSPPNDGTLTAVGTNLGPTPAPAFVSYGGFDISGGDNGMRLLAGRTVAPGIFSLFNVDLTAGTAAPATVASGTNEIGNGVTASADLQDLTIKF
jgi:hypothetical protein